MPEVGYMQRVSILVLMDFRLKAFTDIKELNYEAMFQSLF